MQNKNYRDIVLQFLNKTNQHTKSDIVDHQKGETVFHAGFRLDQT